MNLQQAIKSRRNSLENARHVHCSGVSCLIRQAVAGGAPGCHLWKETWSMKVKELMTPDAKAIWLTESLTDAARLMWENDCGVLPIIKMAGRLLV